jgi:hypothetical protein
VETEEGVSAQLKAVELPALHKSDICEQLRRLIQNIENGDFGEVHSVAWSLEADDNHIHVGLIGQADIPLLRAYFGLGKGMRVIESMVSA